MSDSKMAQVVVIESGTNASRNEYKKSVVDDDTVNGQ
jgi:hypothetical protein